MARILVADDDGLLREYLKIRLAACGHSTELAEDGLAALDCIISDQFDLVILDDVMPGLSGWEVLAAIQNLPSHNAKVLVIGQMTESELHAKAKGFDVSQCLQKPFCAEELCSLVETMCSPVAKIGRVGKHVRSAVASAALAAATVSTSAHAETVRPREAAISEPATDAGDNELASNKLTLGASQQWSWISNGAKPSWHDLQISAEYAPRRSALYTVEVSRSDRFSRTDHLVALRGDWRIARNASAYAALSASPEGNFREKWGVRAGGGLGLGGGIEIAADSRIARYSSGTKFNLNPQLGITSANERIAFTAGWINLWESGGKHYQGWSARVRMIPSERLRLFAGAARYPEIETGITRRVQSAFGGLSYQMSDKLNASLSYARDDYEGAFSRQALTLGIRWTVGNDP